MKSQRPSRRPALIAVFLIVSVICGLPAPRPALAGQRVNLRTLNCVEDFDDASAILTNNYRSDIDNAFKNGLIVGKVSDDWQVRYYDPNALITVGEMANIIARNYGAPVEVVGADAVAYLGTQGITISGTINAPVTVSQLKDIGNQTAAKSGKVDLAVLRDATSGALSPDAGAGITRGHAVEVYQAPPTASAPGPGPMTPVTTAAAPVGPPGGAGGPAPTPPPLSPPPPPPPTPPPPPPAVHTPAITVSATISPDPAKAGSTITVEARTNLPARRVLARSPWGPVMELTAAPGGCSWRGEAVVPPATADGPYVFEVTAFSEWNTASCRAVGNIAGSIFDENTSVITD